MAFLLINPADTARKLFVLGDPLRVNGGSAGGGVAGPSEIPATVKTDGWTVELTFDGFVAGATYDFGLGANNAPTASTPYLLVTSPAFDATGAVTTSTRNVYLMDVQRLPYPDQADPDETESGGDLLTVFVLSDYVYADDSEVVLVCPAGFAVNSGGADEESVAANGTITNSSAVDVTDAEILSGWGVVPFQRVTTSFTAESAGFHRFAKNGKPIACTKFSATDGSLTSPVITAAAMVQPTAGDIPLGVYEGALNLTTLADGVVSINREEFAWIGSASKTTVGGAAAPYLTDGPLPLYKGGTFVYAYVEPGGAGVGAAVSTTAATAKSTPFGSTSAAQSAIRTYNVANSTHGGVIRLMAGNHTLTDAGSALTTSTWLIVERDPDEVVDDVIVNDCANFPGGYFNTNLLCVRNLRIDYNKRLFLGTSAQAVWLDNCLLNQSGSTGVVYDFGFVYITSCTGTGGAILTGDAGSRIQLARNNTGIQLTRSRCWIYNLECTGAYFPDNALFDGGFIYGASKNSYDGSSVPWVSSPSVNLTHGFALVLAQIEQTVGTGPTLAIFADGNTLSANNVLIWNCTIAGQRANTGYVVSGSATLTQWSVRNNSFQWLPTKHDVNGANATYVGGRSFMNEVGCRNNNSELATTPFDLARIGIGSTYGVTGTASNADYVDDASIYGDGTGNGDYAPDVGSILRSRVTLAEQVVPRDIDGTAFAATDAIGAYAQ